MPNHTLLFVSHYIEVLRVFIPHVVHFKEKGYDVKIICQIRNGNSLTKHKELLSKFDLDAEFIGAFNIKFNPLWEMSFFFKLILSFCSPFYLTFQARKKSLELIRSYRPSACIIGSEFNYFNRQMLHNCSEMNIKTILLQWTLAPPDVNLGISSKKNKKKSINFVEFAKSVLIRCVNFSNTFLYKAFNYTNSFKKTTLFSGGGNADKFLVISSRSAEFYLKSGVRPSKLRIMGNPLYEKSILSQKTYVSTDFFTILWANNETRYIYENKYKYEEMVDNWKSKFEKILSISPHIKINFKIHPNWDNPKDFAFLLEYDRMNLITEGDIDNFIEQSDLVISSFSSSMVYSIIKNIPTISYEFPSMPGSDSYAHIGGTIHSTNLDELTQAVAAIFNKEKKILDFFKNKRNNFVKEVLGLSISRLQKGISSSTILEKEILTNL